jgi:ABC-2 type transport system permease protein
VWFVLLLAGGIAVPAASMPGALGDVVGLLPSGALAEGMRTALVDGAAPGWPVFAVLVVWGGAAGVLAARTTKLS